MKLTLIAIPLLAVSLSGQASEDHCQRVYNMAESIMLSRQAGVAMPKMIEVAEGNALATNITEDAYLRPRFSTEVHQQRSARDFANQIYGECLRAMKDK